MKRLYLNAIMLLVGSLNSTAQVNQIVPRLDSLNTSSSQLSVDLFVSSGNFENCFNTFIDPQLCRFSWILNSKTFNQKQTAYRILVASNQARLNDDQGNIWDSKKVLSDSSRLVVYKGMALKSYTRYYWKVQVWDMKGHSSAWSSVWWFETGLLNADQWSGIGWIGASDSLLASAEPDMLDTIASARWLWTTMPSSRNYFRKNFIVSPDKKVASVKVWVQCDNRFELFINGKNIPINASVKWLRVPSVDITAEITSGENKLGIKAFGSNNPLWFVSALRAMISITYADGSLVTLPTDETWGAAVQSNYYSNLENPNWLSDTIGYPAGVRTVIHPRLLRRSIYLRKTFSINGKIKSARAYVTAKGLYELHLNGKKVGDALLTPGISAVYNYYQAFDITGLVKEGKNAIGLITGNGWYNETGWHERYAHKNEVIAKLIITMDDGKNIDIATGKDWKVALSPLIDNGFQGGERYDARLEKSGWDTPDYNDNAWIPVAVNYIWNKPPLLQPFEDVHLKQTPLPVSINEPVTGTYIYDFGQNATGRCRLNLSNTKRGQVIVVRYGERLRKDGLIDNGAYVDIMWPEDNEYDTSNAPFTCRNIDVYICKGSAEETYEPRFTYTGYQYIQVTGLQKKPDTSTVRNNVFYTDLKEIGQFTCSDSVLNRIWNATRWSYRSNIIYGPLDCPTREKNFWSGDMACFAPTACLFMDNNRMLSQWTVYGSKIGSDFPVRPPSPGWDDEVYITPYTLWRYYGDDFAVKGNYAKTKSLVDYRTMHSINGVFSGGANDPFNSDHAQPNGVPDIPKDFTNDAFYFRSVDYLSRMVGILGLEKDHEVYNKILPSIRNAFNETFYSSSGYVKQMQATQIIPLAFGLTDSTNKAETVHFLVNAVRNNKIYPGHLTTGFVSTPFLLESLTDNGEAELAWDLVHQDSYPSWKNMLLNGVNTITEEWGGIKTQKYNSMNHFVYGSIGRWFFESLAGIQNDESGPGYKHIILKPFFFSKLDEVSCSYMSVYGMIFSQWKKGKSVTTWNIHIPVNTTATIYLPSGKNILLEGKKIKNQTIMKYTGRVNDKETLEAGSGSYRFILYN